MKKVDCKWKRLTVNGKKSPVAISACKDLQALVVTVDFFHLQSTFAYSHCQLQSTFCYSLCYSSATFCTMYHNTDNYLPHFVQCITIPINQGWATEVNGGGNWNQKIDFNDPGGEWKRYTGPVYLRKNWKVWIAMFESSELHVKAFKSGQKFNNSR